MECIKNILFKMFKKMADNVEKSSKYQYLKLIYGIKEGDK